MLSCPRCHTALGAISESGVLEAICSSCTFKYRAFRGKLTGRSSRQVTHRRQTTRQAGSYSRSYELRLTLPRNRLEVVAFEIPGRDDTVLVRRGDTVAVLWTMRGRATEDLVYVEDLTTGERYNITAPGGAARNTAYAVALLTFVGLFFLTCTASSNNLTVSFWVSLMGALVALAIMITRGAPTHELAPIEHSALREAQGLLERQRSLLATRSELLSTHDESLAVRMKVKALEDKMTSAGADLYASRLAVLGKGMTILDTRLATEEELLKQLDRAITMVEIELESTSVAAAFPDPENDPLDAQLEHVAELTEELASTEAELLANEELSRYLSADGSA